VAQRPEATALVFGDRNLTYRHLNNKANQLAHRLIAEGIRPDNLVGLCAERGLDLVIGVLGILKAGGAYVPIDPAYPAERVEYMLSDSRVSLLLTTTHLKSFLPTANTPCVLCLDAEQIYADQSSENPKPQVLGLNSSQWLSTVVCVT